MTSPWEKAVDLAVTEAQGLTAVGAAIVAISVGLLGFVHGLGLPAEVTIGLASILSILSAGFGAVFQGAVTRSLLSACCDEPTEFISALRSPGAIFAMRWQWFFIMGSLVALIVSAGIDSLVSAVATHV